MPVSGYDGAKFAIGTRLTLPISRLFRYINVVFVLWLAGCATAPQQQIPVNAQAHQRELAQLQHWQFSGRLAMKSPEQKASANIRWRQEGDRFAIRLSTLVGVTLLTMEGDGNSVTLRQGDKTLTDSDPNRLLYRVTGWALPVSAFPQWAKGAATTLPQQEVAYTELGLLESIAQGNQWRLSYPDYRQQDNGLWLPRNLVFKNGNNEVKIRISRWELAK